MNFILRFIRFIVNKFVFGFGFLFVIILWFFDFLIFLIFMMRNSLNYRMFNQQIVIKRKNGYGGVSG